MYVYMKCVLKNDFMQFASPDLVHCRVGLRGATTVLLINPWNSQAELVRSEQTL